MSAYEELMHEFDKMGAAPHADKLRELVRQVRADANKAGYEAAVADARQTVTRALWDEFPKKESTGRRIPPLIG